MDPVFGHPRLAGVTLIEMLVVLGIVAILATVGAPAFQNLLMDNRMTTRVNEFVSHLHLARSAAIHRQQRIAICPSADQRNCATAPKWHVGWMVFVDKNGDRKRGVNEEILRVHVDQHPSLTITSGLHYPIVFQPEGTSGGSNSTITFCDTRGTAKARVVVLSNSGRVRTSAKPPIVCI